jgi:hypothetical protein
MKTSAIFFMFLLTGCVMPSPQVDVQAKFDEEEIKRYSEPGTQPWPLSPYLAFFAQRSEGAGFSYTAGRRGSDVRGQ